MQIWCLNKKRYQVTPSYLLNLTNWSLDTLYLFNTICESATLFLAYFPISNNWQHQFLLNSFYLISALLVWAWKD